MIKVMGAAKYYGRAVALDGVNLTLLRGEVVGLLGENGAGKTTLLKAMMGLASLNMGIVYLDGQRVAGAAYEKLSFITEEGSSFPGLTAADHGAFYGAMLPRFDQKRFAQLARLFDLPMDKKARSLSRGMRQKLEICVGMSRGADFVLMDEPFLGEDVFTRRDFIKLLIAELTPEQCFVIATHQIQEIEPLISRAVVLKAGKVAADVDMEAQRERGESLLTLVKDCYGYSDERVMALVDGGNLNANR